MEQRMTRADWVDYYLWWWTFVDQGNYAPEVKRVLASGINEVIDALCDKCEHCGVEFANPRSLRRNRYCSASCKVATSRRRNPPVPRPPGPRDYSSKRTRSCSLCGTSMWKTSDVAVLPVCRACRRVNPMLGPKKPGRRHLICPTCGEDFWANRYAARFCSVACYGVAQRVSGYEDFERKQARAARDGAAPGLSPKQRRKLLHLWMAEGRPCAYCGKPATTVDHVIPLGRDGTNFEGNLAPACLTCNSVKKDRLVMEWRTGRQASRTFKRPKYRKQRKIGAVRGTQEALQICYVCSGLYVGRERKTCADKHCQREHLGRLVRDKYRTAHGIPVDPTEPTAYWIRVHGSPYTRKAVA